MTDPVRQFFACYFHQDWRLEYDNYLDAIADFVNGADNLQLKAVLDFVDSFLEVGKSEEFDMRDVGGFFSPAGEGETNFNFLKTIKELILSKKNGISPSE